ncbi:MAG: epoxyqueuosine reductase QueH [bacterium]
MKSKFLLHVCCGPCVVAVLQELAGQFDLTVFYYNPNIHPQEEYTKREHQAQKICQELNIEFIEAKYQPEDWFAWAKDYQNESEGGERCKKCFAMRLEQTAKHASENGFNYFGSTLTSGRNKKADIINPLGIEMGEKYNVEFYQEDWKKKGRQETARKKCLENSIYRQNYCGCVYSNL